MSRTIDRQEMRLVASRRSVSAHLADIWASRELLNQLVRRELKVRYKNSFLGFAWSLLNPAFLMLIYWIVFDFILQAGIPRFPVFLLSGLLIWNFFGASLSGGTVSITSNGYLVGKVRFPREILPLAVVGANFINFLLQGVVLLAVVAISRHLPDPAYFWLWIPALAVAVLLASAGAILLSSFNVYARDTQYLTDLGLLAWQWLTPIVYAWGFVADKLASHGWSTLITLVNPMTPIVICFQRALYGNGVTADRVLLPQWGPLGYLASLAVPLVVGAVLLVVAIRVFDRAEGNFAEVM